MAVIDPLSGPSIRHPGKGGNGVHSGHWPFCLSPVIC